MSTRSYSPKDISVLIGGFYQLDGFVDGTFLNIEKDVAPYSTTRTSDAITARTYRKDDTYTITFTMAQSSPSNDILTKIYQLDSLTQLGKFPLFVKDELGTSLFLSLTTWIKEIPDLNYSQGIENRQWVLQSSQASFSVGGNESPSSDIEDAVNAFTGSVPSIKDFI